MKTFNTLSELFEATKGSQLNAQQLINRRAHINGEWQDFTVSDELSNEITESILEVLGGRAKTVQYMRYTLKRATPQHWGLSRIIVNQYHDQPVRFSYCAGQDYPAELAQIRKYLSK